MVKSADWKLTQHTCFWMLGKPEHLKETHPDAGRIIMMRCSTPSRTFAQLQESLEYFSPCNNIRPATVIAIPPRQWPINQESLAVGSTTRRTLSRRYLHHPTYSDQWFPQTKTRQNNFMSHIPTFSFQSLKLPFPHVLDLTNPSLTIFLINPPSASSVCKWKSPLFCQSFPRIPLYLLSPPFLSGYLKTASQKILQERKWVALVCVCVHVCVSGACTAQNRPSWTSVVKPREGPLNLEDDK